MDTNDKEANSMHKILVVEDNPVNAKIVKAMLLNWGNFLLERLFNL
jgi:CheY-like chemotaxis protein